MVATDGGRCGVFFILDLHLVLGCQVPSIGRQRRGWNIDQPGGPFRCPDFEIPTIER